MNSKNHFLAVSLITFGLFSCSNNAETTEDEAVIEELMEQAEVSELPEEVLPSLSDKIKGTWSNIAKDCDSEGNNCRQTSGSEWVFGEDEVTLGRVKQPYYVSNDTIYIVDSPYRIAREWGDTILMHAMKTDRYMKLVHHN
ncbi:MAG: hypothetical protein EP333_00855 [Bacteroidetes bacterium]|nr:MAG: hypothetical protein EP333_00855 [Bacteroidota bacterium]